MLRSLVKRSKGPVVLGPFFAFACLAGGAVLADGDKKPGLVEPDPHKTLQDVAKNLSKATNYRTAIKVEGGYSDREDHDVTERVVGESYEGDVFGSLMHVPKSKAFRYPTKGVAYIDGSWRDILSDTKTTLMNRLFTFPSVLMTRAVALPPKNARWLTAEEEKARGIAPDDDEDEDEVEAADDEEDEEEDEEDDEADSSEKKAAKPDPKPSGKTVVVKPKSTGSKAGRAPRILRIEAPTKEALQHFIEVQNSGCLSGG